MSGEINTDFGNQMINDNAKSFVVEVEVEAWLSMPKGMDLAYRDKCFLYL